MDLYAVALEALPISTNTLLAEGDRSFRPLIVLQSQISTNTLLAEGDFERYKPLIVRPYFNQHPPRGG